MSRPGWMNESLEEEWVEQDEEQDTSVTHEDNVAAAALPKAEHVRLSGSTRHSQDSGTSTTAISEAEKQGGTFLVREDVLHDPVTPAKRLIGVKGKVNPFTKSFFSPLALEKMFEPPSPPVQKLCEAPAPNGFSGLRTPEDVHPREHLGSSKSKAGGPLPDDEILASDLPDVVTPTGFRLNTHYSFTFQTPVVHPSGILHSTPAEPPLRLFQTYDTYTKDHLYAIANSIDVKSTVGSPSEDGYIRHSKRIKLSAPDDLSEGPSCSAPDVRSSSVSSPTSRPSSRRDYLGESRSLMQQIRDNRSFSFATTVPSEAAPLSVVEEKDEEVQLTEKESGAMGPVRGTSSRAYPQQAASLMARIRSEVDEDMPNDSLRSGIMSLSLRDDSVKSIVALREFHERRHSGSQRSDNASRTTSSHRATPPSRNTSRRSQVLVEAGVANTTPTIRLEPNSPTDPIPPQEGDLISLSPSSPPRRSQPAATDPQFPLDDAAPKPSPDARLGTQTQVEEDMAQFVMTGTAPSSMLRAAAQRSHSGTSTASTVTGVKHPGPSHGGIIRTIAPGDVGPIEQVGDMIWDPERMKWTKLRSGKRKSWDEDLSEDVFRDIESLRDATEPSRNKVKITRFDSDTEEDSTSEEEQYGESMVAVASQATESHYLDSDGFRDDSAHASGGDSAKVPDVSSTRDYTAAQMEATGTEATYGSDFSDLLQRNFGASSDDEPMSDVGPLDGTQSIPQPTPRPTLMPSPSTPHPFPHVNSSVGPRISPTPPKSALKQTSTATVLSSRSSNSLSGQEHVTPSTPVPHTTRRNHRRSVSFSDGRMDGKIVDLVLEAGSSDDEVCNGKAEPNKEKSMSMAPSLRTKRIDELLGQLEQESLEDLQTPSKSNPSSHLPDISVIIPPSARSSTLDKSMGASQEALPTTTTAGDVNKTSTANLVASRPRRTLSLQAQANQTILTECSFAVSQDRLVQAITQIHPYEPHWESLPQINLSNLKIESVAKLKSFLPSLVSLDLHDNQLSYLTGVPSNVRRLRVSNNLLTGVTVYSHLRNLESLDISNNSIDSLTQLECLPLLRDLRADGNSISSIDGLQHVSSLIKLSLRWNKVAQLNVRTCDWSHLEHLDLSSNRLTTILGLASLVSLVSLNLDHNLLDSLSCSVPAPRLRILRCSFNRLTEIDVAPFVNLRTLYMDGNRLQRVVNVDRLLKLENLSLRNQGGGKLRLLPSDIRDVKRLYLSGNPLEHLDFLSIPCYNLLYLELAGCRVSILPQALATSIPNIRVLNLNYNFISDARPLQGLVRLKRLTLVGSRLRGTKGILVGLRNMPDMEMVDLRMNPVTLPWYLPLLVRDVPAALQPSDAVSMLPPLLASDGEQGDDSGHSAVRLYPYATSTRRVREIASEHPKQSGKRARDPSWEDLDAKFRRDLPDDSYLGRLAYRGMVMRACTKIQVIDGVRVTDPERKKAETLLRNVLNSRDRSR